MNYLKVPLLIFAILFVGCTEREDQIPSSSDVEEIPKISVVSPSAIFEHDRIAYINDGDYVLDKLKVQYKSVESQADLRFEDDVEVLHESEILMINNSKKAELTWTTYGDLKNKFQGLKFKIPVRVEKINEQIFAQQVLGYSAEFVDDNTLHGAVFGNFGPLNYSNKVYNLMPLFHKHTQQGSCKVSYSDEFAFYESAIQRTPGAFKIVFETESQGEIITINLHYIKE